MPGAIRVRSRLGPTAGQLLLVAAAILAIRPVAAQASFEKRLTVDASSLELIDLIGEVRLEATDAATFEVIVRVDGRDAREDRVSVEQPSGDPARVLVRFPTDKERNYVYPRSGGDFSCDVSIPNLTGGDRSLVDAILRGGERRIKVRNHGSGLELWADVTLRVPRGKTTTVRLGVGEIHAAGITGDVTLDTQCGPVSAAQITGALVADTGSGAVRASGIRGRLVVDTGSGAVDIEDCTGPEVSVDTGSGHVALTRVETRELSVDTGSGGVVGAELGADAFTIDTGSGGVELNLTRLGSGDSGIDTGSGAIELRLPTGAEAEIHADSGSGSITYDSPDERFSAEDEVSFRIGKGGTTQITLETGSGAIRIRQ